MLTLTEVLGRLEGVKKQGAGYVALCPAHDDKNPSLSVCEKDGKVLLHCHAGCSQSAVLTALGGSNSGERVSPRKQSGGKIVATYPYVDEGGELLYAVVRHEPKKFTQRYPNGQGGWDYKGKDVRRVLFRLPEVLEAIRADQVIYVCEGEKDVLSVEETGAIATTNAMGAAMWLPEYTECLRGANLVVLVDRDDAGETRARSLKKSLGGVAKTLAFRQAKHGKDVTDHLKAGYSLDDLEPWPMPAKADDLAALFDELEGYMTKYVWFNSAHEGVAVTLWCALTHVYDEFELCPYLSITSAEKQSGKTRLLDLIESVVQNPWRIVDPSEAVLFRKISEGSLTVLWDEVDAVFAGPRNPSNEGLRGLLNAGIVSTACVPRCVGKNQEIRDFKVFCPKALAGIGKLPDTVEDRSIAIRMRRRRSADRAQSFRRRNKTEGEALAVRLAVTLGNWVFKDAFEDMPEELTDRAQDCWEPLYILAEAAGERWLNRAKAASLALVRHLDEDSLGIRLLSDIRTIYLEDQNQARISSESLVEGLRSMEESPWPDMGQKGVSKATVAKLLRPYDIRPKNVRMTTVVKGYEFADFSDAWERYLTPISSVTTATPLHKGEMTSAEAPKLLDGGPVAKLVVAAGQGSDADDLEVID